MKLRLFMAEHRVRQTQLIQAMAGENSGTIWPTTLSQIVNEKIKIDEKQAKKIRLALKRLGFSSDAIGSVDELKQGDRG